MGTDIIARYTDPATDEAIAFADISGALLSPGLCKDALPMSISANLHGPSVRDERSVPRGDGVADARVQLAMLGHPPRAEGAVPVARGGA